MAFRLNSDRLDVTRLDAENPIQPRFDLKIHAEYQSTCVRGEGLIWDISETGARIEKASRPVQIGAGLHLEMSLSPGSVPITLSATVVRNTASGFAVRFIHVSERLGKLLAVGLPRAAEFAQKE